MAKRLTDKQKKKIIADYAFCENYSEVARKHKRSVDTVKRIVRAGAETFEIVTKKREQNTLDMLEYMDGKKGDAQLFIDACMRELLTPGKLQTAKVSEITTAMGTVIDKFTKSSQFNENALAKLDKLLEGIDHEAQS